MSPEPAVCQSLVQRWCVSADTAVLRGSPRPPPFLLQQRHFWGWFLGLGWGLVSFGISFCISFSVRVSRVNPACRVSHFDVRPRPAGAAAAVARIHHGILLTLSPLQ